MDITLQSLALISMTVLCEACWVYIYPPRGYRILCASHTAPYGAVITVHNVLPKAYCIADKLEIQQGIVLPFETYLCVSIYLSNGSVKSLDCWQ